MPLYSDSSSYYYGGGGSYTGLYSPYYSPGLYSSNSLSSSTTNPYAPYSSIYSRQNTSSYGIAPSVPSTRSNFSSSRYKPKLTTINESPLSSRGLMPLTRIQSPKFTSSYSIPLKYIPPRPIPINTADIDVSSSRYRKHQVDRKIEETLRDKRNFIDIREESDCNNNKDNVDKNENIDKSNINATTAISADNSCFMPRIDGVEGRLNRSTIRRDRAVVRLSTVRKDRSKIDKTKYTNDENKEKDSKKQKRPITQNENQIEDNSDTVEKTSWREKFGDDLSLKAFATAKKTPGELLRERYFIPNKDEDDCSPVRKIMIPTPPDASNEQMLLEVDPFMHSAIRRLSAPKCPSFHEICEDISSDKIDDDLNAGELRRRASIILEQDIEMINKLQKSTSGSFQQINLERNVSTEDLRKSFSRKSTRKSKKIRHKITAVVDIDNPVLTPIIQEFVENEESTSVPPKFTFNVDAVEEHKIFKLPKKKTKTSPKVKKTKSTDKVTEDVKLKVKVSPKKKVDKIVEKSEESKDDQELSLNVKNTYEQTNKNKTLEEITKENSFPPNKEIESIITSPKDSPKSNDMSKNMKPKTIDVASKDSIDTNIVSPVKLKLAEKSSEAEIFTFDTSVVQNKTTETKSNILSPKSPKATKIDSPISIKPMSPKAVAPPLTKTSPNKPLKLNSPIVPTKVSAVPKSQNSPKKDFPVAPAASKSPFGTTVISDASSTLKTSNPSLNVAQKLNANILEAPKAIGKIQKSDSGEDFWSQIGSRETIFMNKRKQALLEDQWRKREALLEDQSAEEVKNLNEIKSKVASQKLEAIKVSEQIDKDEGLLGRSKSTETKLSAANITKKQSPKITDKSSDEKSLKSTSNTKSTVIPTVTNTTKLSDNDKLLATVNTGLVAKSPEMQNNKDITIKNKNVIALSTKSESLPQPTNVTALANKSTVNRAEEPKIHVATINLIKEESKLAVGVAPPIIKPKTVDSIVNVSPKKQNKKIDDASVSEVSTTTNTIKTPTPTTKDAAKSPAIVTKQKEKLVNSEAVIKLNSSDRCNEEAGRNVKNVIAEAISKKPLGSSPKVAAKTKDTELDQQISTGSPKLKKTNATTINNGGENTIVAKEVNRANIVNDSTVVTVAPVAPLLSQKTNLTAQNAYHDNEKLNASVQLIESSVSQLPPLSQKDELKVNTVKTTTAAIKAITTTTTSTATATATSIATTATATASAAVNKTSSPPDTGTSSGTSTSTPLSKFATVSNLARCLLDVDADLEDFLHSSEGDSDSSYEYSSGSGAENLTDSMKKKNRHRKKKEKSEEPKFDPNKVVKIDPKKKCYVKEEAPRYPLVATPRPLWKREKFSFPEESESDDSDETESESECSTSDEYEDEINPSKDTIIRMSTCSNDSGFEGGTAPPSPKKMLETSYTYAQFQKNGRITAPATTIPRFKEYHVEDFHFLAVLGKGSFGKVLLAELTNTDYYYAVKCLKKDVVLEDDDIECTFIERKVLALGTKHPYLCHLFCTFQTESHLFFVMEYLNGGDLMFHIQESGRFPESRARFYGAEIISGLKFLHRKGIIYRDLKLDNVLLDFEGHVRIADFGMCKLQIYLDKTADSFCGTPDYMAPEIIKAEKYNQNVDWWSFGVLLYEMLIGQSPFSGCDEDELFWSICNEIPWFPVYISEEATSLLKGLLEKDSSKRVGSQYSPAGDVMDHRFFREIDWKLLEARQLEPPFKPQVKHPLDTQYFDKTFTRERVRLTPIDREILQSMDQKNFEGFSYTNPNATLE